MRWKLKLLVGLKINLKLREQKDFQFEQGTTIMLKMKA